MPTRRRSTDPPNASPPHNVAKPLQKPPRTSPPAHSASSTAASTSGLDASLPPALRRELHAVAQLLQRTKPSRTDEADNPNGDIVILEGADANRREQAAQLLARRLGARVQRISLASLLEQGRSDAERMSDEPFTGAEAKAGLLLIDEADALFRKRRASTSRTIRAQSPHREINDILRRLRRHGAASILSASQIRTIAPSMLDAVRAIVRLSGTPTASD